MVPSYLPPLIAAALLLVASSTATVAEGPCNPVAPVHLQVAKDGSITYQEQTLTLDELTKKLKGVKNRAETVVIISAHFETRTGDTQDLIRRLQEIGFQRFTLREKKEARE